MSPLNQYFDHILLVLRQLERKGQGQRRELNQLIDPFKVDQSG